MEAPSGKSKVLPENAYTVLKEGETYAPVVPAGKMIPEVSGRSVLFGLIMVVIFTFAASYIGLKTGNVIECAIPIAIIAIFFGRLFSRRSTLLENVIVQSIGQASGVIVAGAIFTIPALYINELKPSLPQIFIACTLGGFLGVVMLIPLRRYFCRDQHGLLPFPEATAITEVLAAGETRGGSSGRVLLAAFGLGFLYDFLVEFVHLCNLHLNTKVLLGKAGSFLSDFRFEFKLKAAALYFGLGYIIGIRYSAVIAAGSVLSFLVLVPLVYFIGAPLEVPLTPPHDVKTLISEMPAEDIFDKYIKPIGIGCIAMAGLMGILKMGKIIVSSLSLAFKGLASKGQTEGAAERTDRDMRARNVLFIQLLALLGMVLFFYAISSDIKVALVGAIITAVLSFLFTPVAARAIAIVGVNPVSGMTMITLIIACISLAAIGLSGDLRGQSVALVIGCAVCTALSTAGALVSDLKVGYWLGATPAQQQRWKFLGILVAAACVGLVIMLMEESFGFMIINEAGERVSNPDLEAPQGHLMAAIVGPILGGEKPPFILYILGGLVAVFLEMVKVPALAFGLGMYLPIQINMGILAGGIGGYLIGRSGKTAKEKAARKAQGTIIASGILAGSAIMGTLGALLMLDQIGSPIKYLDIGKGTAWYEGFTGQFFALILFVFLIFLCYLTARWGARQELLEEGGKEREE